MSGLSVQLEQDLSSLGILDRVPKKDFVKDMDESKLIPARILEGCFGAPLPSGRPVS